MGNAYFGFFNDGDLTKERPITWLSPPPHANNNNKNENNKTTPFFCFVLETKHHRTISTTMRLILAASVIAASVTAGAAFTPAARWGASNTALQSTMERESVSVSVLGSTHLAPPTLAPPTVEVESSQRVEGNNNEEVVPLTAEEINARLNAQLEKLREKDRTSKQLSKEEINVVYQDEHMIVVDKPSGVLSVSGKEPHPSLARAVFEHIGASDELPTADHMIVHRLGMDTSGLMVLAKDKAAVRGLNGVFRQRKVERRYEALVVGHVEKDEGHISLPVMRDYQFPPYVRISTHKHQEALMDLDVEEVGKKLLEWPKASVTKYEVVSREEMNGFPVTRVTLTSISGRYHQLNVHMAAFGHPIVGDTVYGVNGEAASNGGLSDAELNELAPNRNRASHATQTSIAEAMQGKPACVHAKYLKFRHPVSRKDVEFSSESPF